MNTITIPYKPRELQQQIHKDLKRFNVLVCHRRFGKTVLTVNELIKKCLQCTLPRPRFYYIAPTYSMAKRIAWDYLKYYTSVLPNMDYHETELRAELPNGGRIQLLGCERPQTLKGLYIDGVVLDEVAQMPPKMWTEVIRPALSDREGFMIAIGTPQGHNSFFDLYNHGLHNDKWYATKFKASETKVVKEEELAEAKSLMPPEIYEAEYECSFESSAIGAIYSQGLNEIGTGKSRVEIAQSLGLSTSIVPKMPVDDGINAVRMTLSRCYFDFEKTKEGLDALRQYKWAVDDKGVTKNRPQHDWTSHSADAFRYLCTGLQETKNWSTEIKYPRLGIV